MSEWIDSVGWLRYIKREMLVGLYRPKFLILERQILKSSERECDGYEQGDQIGFIYIHIRLARNRNET